MYKNPDFTDLKLETFLELLKRDFSSSVRNMSATCAIIFICVIVTTSSV